MKILSDLLLIILKIYLLKNCSLRKAIVQLKIFCQLKSLTKKYKYDI